MDFALYGNELGACVHYFGVNESEDKRNAETL